MFDRCHHDWKLLSETVTESHYEHMSRVADKAGYEVTEVTGNCANRKHIQVFTCEKCGELKRFVENI